MLRLRGLSVYVYIDDNALSARTEAACYAARGVALEIAQAPGWPIAEAKLKEGRPCSIPAFRGVFVTRAQTLSIPVVVKLEASERRTSEVLTSPRPTAWKVRGAVVSTR